MRKLIEFMEVNRHNMTSQEYKSKYPVATLSTKLKIKNFLYLKKEQNMIQDFFYNTIFVIEPKRR